MAEKKKAKMGRPPLDDPRTLTVTIKITPKERARLAKAAKAAGMSFSAYIMLPHRKKKGQ